jgi:twinkle protein
MKYQSSNTKTIINIDWGTQKKRFICPDCSKQRQNKKTEKCLEYYPDTDSAYCFHCNTTFFKYNPHQKEREYSIPEWKNKTDLTDKSVKWFEGRMIKQNTLKEFKIYSDEEFIPQFEKKIEVICFPYFKNEKLINVKFRGAKKSFKMVSNAELIFWNIDVLSKFNEVVIVEGEMDLLSYYQVGIKNVISVPNGANKNLEYLDSCIDAFESIEKVFLAVDQDTKGIELRDELARRIGLEKCYIVSFKNCKDANEYMIEYGGIELYKTIKNAISYPMEGIVTVDNMYNEIYVLYEEGIKPGEKINIELIDKYISWELGRLAVVTGIPSSGKSEFVDYLISRLNVIHKWKAGFFTPENYPLKFHYSKIFEKIIGKQLNKTKCSDIEFNLGYEYIKDNFFWVMNEEDTSVDTVLLAAKNLIKTKGIKIFVIDPYNRLDHKYTDTETQYISRFLDKLTNFARFNKVLLFLIAHPTKMRKNATGKYDVPTLYDISGSANFYNKADYGFTIHRATDDANIMQNQVEIHWQKIKFKHLGQQGITEMKYNYNNGRFEEDYKSIDNWDNSCWLINDNNLLNEEKNEVYWYNIQNDTCPF